MKDIIKKSFLLGLGAASLTKRQAEKIVKELVKNKVVSVKDGREMLNRVKKTALSEGKRIKKLAETETKRLAKNVDVVSKGQLTKMKKMLMSLDKELTSKGKKTLKSILK